jgi:F0F1-type ATP synthase assembly protein I
MKARSGVGPGRGGADLRRKGAAYQGALEAVFAILVAVAIGYFVDRRFGTSPGFLFVGVVLGFSAFVLRLVRLGRALTPPDGEAPGGARGPEEPKGPFES